MQSDTESLLQVNIAKEKEAVVSISEEEIINVRKNWASKAYPSVKEPAYPV